MEQFRRVSEGCLRESKRNEGRSQKKRGTSYRKRRLVNGRQEDGQGMGKGEEEKRKRKRRD